MWYDEAVVYQIYPLGLCGAPLQNDGDQAQAGEHRILRVLDWVEHIKRLGATCVLFNPLFESDAHGYDTRDYNKVDCRLGTNDDLRQVCAALHAAGIKILFDGVFNMWPWLLGVQGRAGEALGQPVQGLVPHQL